MKIPFQISSPLACLRRVVGLACLLGSLCTQQAYAQPTLTANPRPDLAASNTSAIGVQNTGADHVPLAGKTLRVMCWDGAQPGLGWSFGNGVAAANAGTVPLQGAALGKVQDPDIVADPGEFGARTANRPTTDVLVTYLLNGYAVYEVWEYDINNNVMQPVVAPTGLASALSVYGEDAGPNVDVDGNGRAVITWSQDYNIWARAYDMPTRTASSQNALIASDNIGGRGFGHPDVAVNHLGGGHGGTVSFIYVQTNRQNNAQWLRMRQVPYLDVEYGVQFYNDGIDVLPNNPGGQYEFPRIAAPNNDVVFGSSDFEAVVADGSNRTVLGLNIYRNNAFVSPANLPVVSILSDAQHLGDYALGIRPVVAYCFDSIEVAWTLVDDQLPRLFNGTQEIIQMPLNNSGRPSTILTIINQHVRGNQAIPSLAGRFSSFLATNAASSQTQRALYCFYDELQQEVFYKSLDYYNASMRTAATSSTAPQPIAAYPNPFQEETTLTLSLADDETVQSLEVYDPMGQPVRGLKLPLAEGKGAQQVRWEAASLKPGIYQVRMHTSTGKTYNYRVQHD